MNRAFFFILLPSLLLPSCREERKTSGESPKSEISSEHTALQSSFRYVLTGTDAVEIGETVAENFIELVAGIYEGSISESDAGNCLIRREAIFDCAFQTALEDRLIYDGVLTARQHFQFALTRNPTFEKDYDNPLDLYGELKDSGFNSDDPIHRGDLVFIGRETFTTKGGILASLPVFRVVNFRP